MTRLVLLTTILLLGVLPSAFAEDAKTRTIALPRHGLTLEVPDGWAIEQYGDALLELSKGKARLWIRTYDAPSKRPGMRVWSEQDGDLGVKALVERDGEPAFEIEGVLSGSKARQLKPVVEAMLDSLDTTRYVHDTRHVDWTAGWTLDLPEGFTRKATKSRIARFESEFGYVEVAKLEALYRKANGKKPGRMSLGKWGEFAASEGVARIQHETALVPGIRVVEEGETAHLVSVEFAKERDGEPEGILLVRVGDDVRVLFWSVEDGAEAGTFEAPFEIRPETDPGPQVSGAPTDRFPGEAGPPVAFDLPDGWTVSPGSNQMRLAQLTVAGVENADVAVFYFGAGGGGDIPGNLKRWRDQMGGAEGKTETVEVAEDVKATLLDVKGSFQSSGMGGNPHGGNPHGMGHDDFRMLAAILEVPKGPIFVKWVGPEAKIETHAKTFRAWISSFRVVR